MACGGSRGAATRNAEPPPVLRGRASEQEPAFVASRAGQGADSRHRSLGLADTGGFLLRNGPATRGEGDAEDKARGGGLDFCRELSAHRT
eukprot:5244769-Alexandrium_andersonii.AAC.1